MNEIKAKVSIVIWALDTKRISRTVHISFVLIQKSKMIVEIAEDAKFWRLRANMMFLMMSLRFFKYFFKIASTVAEVIEQNKQNITPKLYVVYSSTL